MRSISRSLAWKEWHEHKWKLAAITAILCGVSALVLANTGREMLVAAQAMLLLSVFPLALFIGAGTAAGERSQGTLLTLQALPVPAPLAALYKLVAGLITLILPIVATLLFIWGWCQALDWFGIDYSLAERMVSQDVLPWLGTDNWFVDTGIMISLIAASIYLWTAAAGVNRADEVSAGAVALAVMVVWWTVLFLAWFLFTDPNQAQRELGLFETAVIATAPAGVPLLGNGLPGAIWIPLTVAAVMHVGLGAWFVTRFARIANREVRSPRAAVAKREPLDWIGIPRSSPISAIVWKQCRESGPIVLAGLAGVIGITTVFLMMNTLHALRGGHRDMLAAEVVDFYGGMVASLGMMIALVTGIGVCLYDVTPKLNTFWRSRPIDPNAWFWIKFATGLIVFVAAMYLPAALLAAIVHPDGLSGILHRETAMLVLVHFTLYATAVALACLVRQAVYAAILSVGAIFAGLALLWLAWRAASLFGWTTAAPATIEDLPVEYGTAALALTALVGTLAAWLAMRNDWGWKSGRG